MDNVFTYWDGDQRQLSDFKGHWQSAFPDFIVIDRAMARELLTLRYPEALDAYDRINLPACRSDIARLLQLEASGGLYVDAHCKILDFSGAKDQAQRLGEFEIVVSTRYAPNFRKVMPHNSIVWARPNASSISRLLEKAIKNLLQKAERESVVGFESYHVWDITGPGVFWRELFDPEFDDGRVVESYSSSVATIFEDINPIQRHIFTGYRKLGDHWSERQRSELLFAPAMRAN